MQQIIAQRNSGGKSIIWEAIESVTVRKNCSYVRVRVSNLQWLLWYRCLHLQIYSGYCGTAVCISRPSFARFLYVRLVEVRSLPPLPLPPKKVDTRIKLLTRILDAAARAKM